MGADKWFKDLQRSNSSEFDVMAISGNKIWPSYDLHYPSKRPLHHVNRATPGNRKYPLVRMSLPIKTLATTVQPSSTEQQIQFDDVFKYVERQRVRSSCHSRRQTVENGRRSVQSRLEMSRPQSCITSSSVSRPKPLLPRRSTMDSISMLSSLDNTTRPISVADSEVSSFVQKHCCELMGPSVCTSCSKKNTILINRARSQSSMSSYRVTTENIATVAMVQRILPQLTSSEIQEQLENGGICRLQRVNCWNRDKYINEDDGDDEEKRDKIPTLNLAKLRFKNMVKKTTTPNYFRNIRQLNQKVVSGAVDLGENRFFPIKNEPKRTESPYPVFVSPKKNSLASEPKFKAYYEPPLLEKDDQIDPFAATSVTSDSDDAMLRQQPKRLDSDSEDDIDCLSTSRLDDVPDSPREDNEMENTEKAPYDPPLLPKENQIEEPSFFAGSVIPYTLPERAPDKLGSFDMSRLNGELTSSESENEN
ncbi:hypothetical protein LOTGIDRAFT_168229 [Lottia gigantea]|uniref:Uncharacterized protein n=1 Tax=Lottia gigantea TaxID=225164 RepID=V3ZVL4_LOTGI|nr:hypothetical protein LOTGIDRAFT_168229 [Lottia gigantea]ESO84971.1 hypothetical protein LOTGIDRAFT_168229 [Lottia gigantea]